MKKYASLILSAMLLTNSILFADTPKITVTPPSTHTSEEYTDLYIWRHGETDSNKADLVTGGGDITTTLTEVGHQQARNLGQKVAVKGIKFDIVYSSDMQRSIKTAEAVLAIYPQDKMPPFVLNPQLREVLQGRFERFENKVRAEIRKVQIASAFEMMTCGDLGLVDGLKEGSLDRYYFWKHHSLSTNTGSEIIDVEKYLADNVQEPETYYQLYCRIHQELVRIAENGYAQGQKTIGISGHGGMLSTLVLSAVLGEQNVFFPMPFYPTAFEENNVVIMPEAPKVPNCTLTHFRYWHGSQQLEFCGFVE